MGNHLMRIIDKALPSATKYNVTYNKANNIYLTDGYTSKAGNTYFQGIRLSDRIVVKENIGIGYWHTFLNGIQVYGFDGNDLQLIGSESFHCCHYSKETVRREATELVKAYLENQCTLANTQLDINTLKELSSSLVETAFVSMNRLEA